MSVVGVSVILHFVSLVIRPARVVHHHDKRTVERSAHRSLIERLRCVGLCGTHGLAVFVAEGIGELPDRITQCQRKNVIDRAEHLGLAFLNVGRLLIVSDHTTQLQSKLAQLRRHHLLHLGGVVAGEGLRHDVHWHQSVFLAQVSYTTESSTVADGVAEEKLHTRVVHWLTCTVDDPLQHEVGLFQLIIEEQIRMRELHAHRVAVSLGKVGAQHVETREHPASA